MFERGCDESLRNRKGLNHELEVFKAVEETFKDREAFGILHYPIFHPEYAGGREADILLVDKELGIIVIEVKGLVVNQVTKMVGHTWMYEGFYTEEGSPYLQAKNQMELLCKIIDSNCLLSNKDITKRVFVALPQILETDWKFNGRPHNPPILFQNDLSSTPTFFDKISSKFLSVSNETISDEDWEALKKYFSVDSEEKFVVKERNEEDNMEKYSSVYIIDTVNDKVRDEIAIKLKQGIKVYLLTYSSVEETFKETNKKYIDAFQLLIYEGSKTVSDVTNIIIRDGDNFDQTIEDIIKNDFPQFNINQYKITHESVDSNLMITAGAGTGKTHVMIDRILYILSTSTCSLKDISMITFTNDSTNEMRKRLTEKFLTLYQLTHSSKYLLYTEDVKDLEISTIDSFAKSLLTILGHELGYGLNITISNLKKEKNDIIESLVDEYFESNGNAQGWIQELRSNNNFNHYDLTNKIKDFWTEMHTKGLTINEIEGLDWGTESQSNQNLNNFQALFKYVFERCEKELDLVKKQRNVISMGDFTRKLRQFSDNKDVWKQVPRKKILFIDEFQDSDDGQIEMIANLCAHLKCRLFVVGDIKQSIYKFRGANSESFTLLEEKVDKKGGIKFKKFSLNQNYRTMSTILKEFDEIFKVWGDVEVLPYKIPDDELIGMKHSKLAGIEEIVLDVNNADNDQLKTKTQTKVVEILENYESLKTEVGLIVRTNKEGERIKEWCENDKIEINNKVSSPFYGCQAVKDFKVLLDALLYPQKAQYVLEVLKGPYFGFDISLDFRLKGNNDEINNFLKSNSTKIFYRYVEQLKSLHVMSVIQMIIYNQGLFKRLTEITSKEDKKQYIKNLSHLINIIQTNFSLTSNNLYVIHKWLEIQIKTNQTEEEPLIVENNSLIEIITAHKSKGLEYNTVILPFMTNEFDRTFKNIYFSKGDNQSNFQVGWQVFHKNKNNDNEFLVENSFYDEFKEVEKAEVKKEETRLLYVALTRVKEKLIVILPKENKTNTREVDKANTWSSVFSIGRGSHGK